jgi:hypothetical protein
MRLTHASLGGAAVTMSMLSAAWTGRSATLALEKGARGTASAGYHRAPVAQQQADSVIIARYLGRRGLALADIVAHRDEYYAVIGQRGADSARYLVALELVRDSVTLLREPDNVGTYDPTDVRWVSLGDSVVDGLLVSYDIPLEGVVGTTIFALARGRLMRVFHDDKLVCKPAELRDLDGDGRPELLAYVGDPAENCGDLCHTDLRDRFDMVPAWVAVLRWTGTAWIQAERHYPAFYRQLALTYDQIDTWLAKGPDSEQCRTVYWLSDRGMFHKWALRAGALGSKQR